MGPLSCHIGWQEISFSVLQEAETGPAKRRNSPIVSMFQQFLLVGWKSEVKSQVRQLTIVVGTINLQKNQLFSI